MPTKTGNVLSWAEGLDDKTMQQAQAAASLPFIDGHLALMPDAHYGYGSTVGSVIPTKGAIIPSAIGVDIGCGMIAVETCLTSAHLGDDLTALHEDLRRAIPAGMGQGHDQGDVLEGTVDRLEHYPGTPANIGPKAEQTALNQFGSLGGGNHFVEVCLDERDRVWVVLHSGSRGIGNQLARYHMDIAKGLMKHWFVDVDPDLAYLVEGTEEFNNYIRDMLWAQEYALGNREAMMDRALFVLQRALGAADWEPPLETRRINCHHNYTEMENHRGRNVWLTRKGAIRARQGDLGVIPGSMGAASYIVSGLGNAASYHSCSHGAGRRLGRKAAERTLSVEDFTASMGNRQWDREMAAALLDEAPAAYKDIDEVMAAQRDLVTIQHRLTQVLNLKGLK